MQLNTQLAKQIREVKLNGRWISTNLKTELADVDWQMANTKIGTLNTIADLAFHLNYYVAGLNRVFAGGPLDIRDKYSFDRSPVESAEDWDQLRQKVWDDAEQFAQYVEQMPEHKISEGFVDEKYGSYYRNIIGMVEHSYYHLGQVVIIKKLIREGFGS